MSTSVSVYVVLQNNGKYIDGLIATVLPQLSESDEIVLIGTGAVETARHLEDIRIKAVEGPACSFSDAAAQCKNDIVFFCSESDVWVEDKAEKVLRIFDEDPACTTVLHDLYAFRDDIGEKSEELSVKYKKGFNRNIRVDSYKASCMAVRKSFIEGMVTSDEFQLPFCALLGLVSEKAGKTVYIPERLVYHRFREDDKTAEKGSLVERFDLKRRLYCEYEVLEDSYHRFSVEKTTAAGTGALDKLKNIAWILIIVFVIDSSLFGAGRLIEFGYVSFRMLIFAAAFITSFPLVLKNWKRLLRNPIVYLTWPFSIVLVIWFIYGYYNGNPFEFIWTDFTSCLTLALVPGVLCVVDSRKKITMLTNVVFYSGVTLAAVSTFIQFIAVHYTNMYYLSYFCVAKQLGGFDLLRTGTWRVFFLCSIYVQVALMLGIWKIWNAPSLKKKWLYYSCEGLLLYAWIISYTRSFWIGLAGSVLFVILWQPRIFLKCCKAVIIPILVAALIMGFSWINEGSPKVAAELYNRIIITIEQQTGTNHGGTYRQADRDSQDIRTITKYAEIARIKQHPFVGRGLGAYLEGVRIEPRVEYTYLDVMMKLGGIGTFFFAFAFLAFIIQAFAHRTFKPKKKPETSFYTLVTLIISGYVGFMAASATNPFLISPLGIAYLLFTEAAVYNCRIIDIEAA